MGMTPEERASFHGQLSRPFLPHVLTHSLIPSASYYELVPASKGPPIPSTQETRSLIGASSLEVKRKRARARHEKRELSSPFPAGMRRIIFASDTARLTPAQEELERQRRTRREKCEEHDRQKFEAGRLYERAFITNVKPPAPSATRLRTPEQRERLLRLRSGFRQPRNEPVALASFYVDGILPAIENTTREHQRCSLCKHVKCHPVSYVCGHSHCYACIRLHLETDWACPSCFQVMQAPPHRHEGEEQSLRLDYPNWCNTSKVLYSFDGLTFPVLPKQACVSDSE
ncbi:hypothetical protein C8R43DRAFT_1130458 [Mycena crocata]|nr:hypothetical protein C8R43DRAFT_1130458 [Mycena crocata]